MAQNKGTYTYRYKMQVEDMLGALLRAKSAAEGLDDTLENLGDRGSLNDLIREFVKLDNTVDALSSNIKSSVSKFGRHLKSGYMKNLDQTMLKLSQLSKRSREVFSGIGSIDIKSSDAKGQLMNAAKEVNDILGAIGSDTKIDLEEFGTKNVKAMFKELIRAAEAFNKSFKINLGNIDTSQIESSFKDASSGIAEAVSGTSKVVQDEIDKLEKQNRRLLEVKNKFQDTVSVAKKMQASPAYVPDNTKFEVTIDNVADSVRDLLGEYKALEVQLDKTESGSVDYINTLTKMLDISSRLSHIRQVSRDNDGISNLLKGEVGDDGTLMNTLRNHTSNIQAKLVAKILGNQDTSNIDVLLRENAKRQTDMETRVLKALYGYDVDDDGLGGKVVDSDIESLEDEIQKRNQIIDKVKEYNRLIQERDKYKGGTKEYKEASNNLERFLGSFSEFKSLFKNGYSLDDLTGALYDFEDDGNLKNLEGTLNNIFGMDFSNAFSMGDAIGEMERVQNIASKLEKVFDTTHVATVEYKVLMNGQNLDIRAGGNEEVTAKTKVESWLANLDQDNIVNAHSHMGKTSTVNAKDFENAMREYYNGVAKMNAIIGRDDITTLNFANIKQEDAEKVLQKLRQKRNAVRATDLNKMFAEINSEYSDVKMAQTWKPSKFEELAQYIFDVGQSADNASTPLERFKNILSVLTDGKIDLSKYNKLFDNFSQENAGNIFNQIAKSEGILDGDGNILQVDDISKSPYSQVIARLESEREELYKKRNEAREAVKVTYQDIVDEVDRIYQKTKDGDDDLSQSLFAQYFHPEDMKNVSKLFTNILDGIQDPRGVANQLAYDFGFLQEDMVMPFDEMGASAEKVGNKIVDAQAKVEEFEHIVDSFDGKELMDNEEIGATKNKLESLKSELEELAQQGDITAEKMQEIVNAYDVAQQKLRKFGSENYEYNEPMYSEGEMYNESVDRIRAEAELDKAKRLLAEQAKSQFGEGASDGTIMNIEQLEDILRTLKKVRQAVNEKTQAFEKEAKTVNQIIPKEIQKLKQLEQVLDGLKTAINGLFDNLQTNVFSALESDIQRIEVSAKTIGDAWKQIGEQSKKITSDPNAGDGAIKIPQYALDVTLGQTNSILNSILAAINADDGQKFDKLIAPLKDAASELNKVASGIVERQKVDKTTKTDAIDRILDRKTYNHMQDVVRNKMLASWDDVDIGPMEAMKDGIVQVEGAMRDAGGEWKGFIAKLDASHKIVDIATDGNYMHAKSLNAQAAAAKKLAKAESDRLNEKETVMHAEAVNKAWAQGGEEVRVQYKDNKRYTVSRKQNVGGLTREIFQTYDGNEELENMQRTTVTVSNKVQKEMADMHKRISDNFNEAWDSTRLDVYNKEHQKLMEMNERYGRMDDLSDDDISAWNDQILLVQTLGNEIDGVIKRNQKLEAQKGIAPSSKRLQEYGRSANEAFKDLDFSLTDYDSNNTTQQKIIDLRDQIVQKISDYKNTVLTDSQIEELDDLTDKLKKETDAYKENMKVKAEAEKKAKAQAKLPQTISDNLKSMDEYKNGLKNIGLLSDDLSDRFDDLRDRMSKATDVDQVASMEEEWSNLRGEIDKQQNSQDTKKQKNQRVRDIKDTIKAIKDEAKALDFDNLTDSQSDLKARYDNILTKLDDAKSDAGRLSQQEIAQLEQEAKKIVNELKTESQAQKTRAENQAKQEAQTKLPTDIQEQVKSMDAYKKGLKNVGLLTDDLANKFDDLRQRMKNATDPDDFKAMQDEWVELQKHIDAQQSSDATKNRKAQIEQSLGRSIDSIKKETKGLDFDIYDKDLVDENENLAEKVRKTLTKLDEAKRNSGKNSQEYIAALEAEANSLVNELRAEVQAAKKKKDDEIKATQAQKDAEKQRVKQEEFELDKLAQYETLNDYKKWAYDYLEIDSDLRARLAELGPMIYMSQDEEGLKKFKEEFKKVKKDVDKGVADIRKKTGESLVDSVDKEFKSLKIDPNASNLTKEQQDILDTYNKLNKAAANYQDRVKRGAQAETREIESLTNVLERQIQAYKQRNDYINPKNAKFGKTAEINASIKNNSIVDYLGYSKNEQTKEITIGNEMYANSKVMSDALEKYANAYDALIKKRKALISSPDPISEADEMAYKQLTKECNEAAKAVEKIVDATEKLHSQKIGSTWTLGDDIDTNNVNKMRSEYEEFVGTFDNVVKGSMKFDETMNQMNFSIKNTDGTITNLTAQLDAAGTHIVATAGKVEKSTSAFGRFFGELQDKFKSVSTYIISITGIEEAWQQLRMGVQYVREIDLALTELKKVTNETSESYANFIKTASKESSAIGSTVKDFTTVTADFARLGYSMQDASELAKTALIYENVGDGFQSVDEASSSVISTMQAFGMEANNAMSIVDRFNEVGNNFAISSKGIGDALQRSASALYESGNTIDESIAMITAANTVVQDPDKVGTALKTLSLRLRGAKADLEDAGLETEGMATSTAKLRDQLFALTGGKVDIMLDDSTFKSTIQILREMSEVWDDMSDIDSAAALELMAGKMHANTMAALISNFDIAEEALATSLNSEGSAITENEKYMQSIQGHIDQFNNALQSMWYDELDDGMLTFFVDLGTALMEVVDTVGLLPGLLSGAFIFFTSFKQSFSWIDMIKESGPAIKNFGKGLQLLGASANDALNSLVGINDSFGSFNNNMEDGQLSNWEQFKKHIGIGAIEYKLPDDDNVLKGHIDAFNELEDVSADALQQFIESMGDLSSGEIEYFNEIEAGEATVESCRQRIGELNEQASRSQRIRGILTGIGNAMLSIGASLAIDFALQAAMTAIDNYIHRLDKLKEASAEVLDDYSQANQKLSSMKSTINDVGSEYAVLSQGVDEFGNNISLTSSEYERYQSIVNQIASTFPEMVSGYNAEGNAILSLKGNVEELEQAYLNAASAARQSAIAGSNDVFDAFKLSYDSDPSTIFGDTGLKQKQALANKLIELIDQGDSLTAEDFFNNLKAGNITIDGNKYSNIEAKDLYEAAGIDRGDFDSGTFDFEGLKEQRSALLSYVKTTTSEINAETSKVKTIMDAYLGEDEEYQWMGHETQNAIKQMVSNMDAEFFGQFDSASGAWAWIESNIVDQFKDNKGLSDEIAKVFDIKGQLQNDEVAIKDYKAQVESAVNYINDLEIGEEAKNNFKSFLGLNTDDINSIGKDIDTMLAHAQNVVGDNLKDKILDLNYSDLVAINSDAFNVDGSTIETWEQLQAEIKEAKIAMTQDFTTDNFSDYASSVTNIKETIDSLQGTMDSISSGSMTPRDFAELVTQMPELAEGVEVTSDGVFGLEKNLRKLNKSAPKQLIKELEAVRESLIEAGKSTDGIDALITSIENMPQGTVSSLADEFLTLEDAMGGALEAQGRLAAAMSEDPNAEYKSYAEGVEELKTLLKSGMTGSSSKAWSIFEAITGEGYDWQKTLTENEQVLKSWINTYGSWFEGIAGDDADEYSHKGMVNFLEDAESIIAKAKQSGEEWAEAITWTYNNGELDIDFANTDWEAIADGLGITSEMFGFLMEQVAQFYAVDFETGTDLVAYLDNLTESGVSAAQRMEQVNKSVQDHLEQEGLSLDWLTDGAENVMIDGVSFSDLSEETQKVLQAYWALKTEIETDPIGLQFNINHDQTSQNSVAEELAKLSEGGNVDLTLRPQIDTSELEKSGWGEQGEGVATVFTNTFSNKDGTVAINFTPIMTDENGNYIRTLSPDELTQYAEEVVSGVREDDLNLQIGAAFEGEDAIQEAEDAAQKIHELHEGYEFDGLKISDSTLNSLRSLTTILKSTDGTQFFVNYTELEQMAKEAGYGDQEVQNLIESLEQYQNVIGVRTSEEDLLGLLSIQENAAATATYLEALKIQAEQITNGDNTISFKVSAESMVDALVAANWSPQQIQSYMTTLENSGTYNFTIDGAEVNLDNTDAQEKLNTLIEDKSQLSEGETTNYEITGGGQKALKNIIDYWKKVPTRKTTTYTIKETTVKTEQKGGILGNLFNNNNNNNQEDTTDVNGTAHVRGTAYKGGSWGAPRTETALVGELGPEMVVRNGRWFTVGENGAEFTDIKRGDIIFNHKQTEQLLSRGYVIGRGKAYASGTAYAEAGGSKNWGYYSSTSSSSSKKSSNSNSTTEDAAEQIVDFIEIKLEEIEDIISKTTAEIENMVDDTTQLVQKNNAYDKLVATENEKAETYMQAAKVYADRASELLNEIPEEYKEMAKNGAIAIEDFIGEDQAEIADAINEYREYAQKADSAELGYLEAIAQKSAYRVEQLEQIASDFENLVGWINTESELLQAQMDLVEESGGRLSENFYKELIKNSNEQLNYLKSQKVELQNAFNQAVESGDIQVGTQDWYDAIQQIAEVDAEIIQCNTDIEEFNNSINDLKWDNLEKLMHQFDALDDELSHLYDRFTDNDDVVGDSGNWTSKGIAALGIAAQQMELAQTQAQKYGDAIDQLQKDYKNGLYSVDEYNEKLAELKENQWDSIEAYEDAKDAIVDLNKTRIDAVKDGMEKELDAYKELIEKKKEALDADKDLYDFEKSVNEQQKTISDLRRELLAISGDTSASAAAKRATLNAELAKAEAALADTYYENSIDKAKDALDASYEFSEERTEKEIELLEKSLEDEEKIVADSLNTVKSNASEVLKEINDVAKTYGIDITDSIVNPWKSGSNAISGYKDSFTDLSDAFSKEIDKIVAAQNKIIDLYDSTAKTTVSNVQSNLSNITSAIKKEEPKIEENANKNDNVQETKPAPVKGDKVVIDSDAQYYGGTSGNIKIPNWVKGNQYTVQQVGYDGKQVLLKEIYSWVKISDLQGYAKGTTGVKNDQWAWIDELGEELVLHAGSDGKLAYLTKGSSVIPSDLTKKLMNLAVDPTQTLEYSRPSISAPHIVNNEININMEFGEVVHIDTVTNDTIPDLTKAIEKQMDKYLKNVNQQLRKYTR